jgi:hypothetical protein
MTAPVRTFIEADVKCYHCGQISGVVRVDRGVANPTPTFIASGSDAETPIQHRAQLRCLRCNGPTYFDEFEQRQQYARIDFLEDRPRRGRPPKRLVERRGAA